MNNNHNNNHNLRCALADSLDDLCGGCYESYLEHEDYLEEVARELIAQ